MKRTVALTGTAAAAVLALAPAASAAPPSTTSAKSTGGQASVQWTEQDPGDALRLPGNVHVGYLSVYQQPGWTEVYGWIDDYDCAPGQELPSGHGEPDGSTCALAGTRFLSADPGAVAFTSDARARTASLTGTLTVSNGGHGEPGSVLATPPADVRWTGAGEGYDFTRTDSWTDGTSSYSSRVKGSGYDAVVTGRLGAMGFADDADDVSAGAAEQWRETSRSRTRG